MSSHNHSQYYNRTRRYRVNEDRENTNAYPSRPRSREHMHGYADEDEEKNVVHDRTVFAGHDTNDIMSHDEDIDRGYGGFDVDFSDRVRNMLRCGVCGSQFTCNGMYTPLQSWSCGHTICQYCVLTQAHQTKTASDQYKVSCPLCEAPHAFSIHNENQQQTSILVLNLLSLIESANAADVDLIPQSTPIRQEEEFRSYHNNYDRHSHPKTNREDWRHQKPNAEEIVPFQSYSNGNATDEDDWHNSSKKDSWQNDTGMISEKIEPTIEHFPNEVEDWRNQSERDEGEWQKSCTDSNSGTSSGSNSGDVATSVVSGNRRNTAMAVSRVAAYRRWNQQQKLQKHSAKSTVVAALLQKKTQQTQQPLGILPYQPKASSEPKRRSKYLSHQKTVSDRMLSLSSHKSGGNLLEDCERAIMHNLTMSTVQDEPENQNYPNTNEKYLENTKQKLQYQEEEEEAHQNTFTLQEDAKESFLSRQTHQSYSQHTNQQHLHEFKEEKPQSRFYKHDENQTSYNENKHIEDDSHRLRFRKKFAIEEQDTADSFQNNDYHERNASVDNKRHYSRYRSENKHTATEDFQSHRVSPIDEQKQQTINSHSSSEIDKSKSRTQSKYISKYVNHESTNTNYSKQAAFAEPSNKRYQTSPDVTEPTTVSSSVASFSLQSDVDICRDGACYLVYDEPNGGKLQLHYSKTHLSHSLGSWMPGPSSNKKIQGFKFQQNGGRVDLIKGNDVVNKRKFFDAWCQFVKIAITYSSILFKWDDDFRTPIDIYVHYGGGNGPVKLQFSQENGVEVTKDIQAICVLPAGHRMFLGVQSMNLGVFTRQGNTSGVTLTC